VEALKRFWTAATVEAIDGGHAVRLDGRPVRTPAGRPLLLPSPALAQAVAGEWTDVGEHLDPTDMPLTGLANAAIDLVPQDRAGFVAGLAAYAASDLTCYRADGPQLLVARQVAAWEPVLKAVEARHGLLFRRTAGVVPVAQPDATLTRAGELLMALGNWRLAPLQPLVTLSGSLVVGLALMDRLVTPDAAFEAAVVDERWQAEHWGEDAEAAAALGSRETQFMAAARFLALID
jgi:chaperone required for assembly of F1-ATPase